MALLTSFCRDALNKRKRIHCSATAERLPILEAPMGKSRQTETAAHALEAFGKEAATRVLGVPEITPRMAPLIARSRPPPIAHQLLSWMEGDLLSSIGMTFRGSIGITVRLQGF